MINRIFGIGLSRTGTTSLTYALQYLGFETIHYPSKKLLFDPNLKAVTDIPVARYFKELDKKFPNSKFIYTVRDIDSWLISIERHFNTHSVPHDRPWFKENRIEVYGDINFNKKLYQEAYEKHDKDVRKYFKGRDDLLILDIVNGNGWDELSEFLGFDISKVKKDFPHARKKK